MANTKKTLLLTGASRGIGHATVKHFHAAEWRVITVSRQPFDKICPWPQGEKDHIQADLNDTEHYDATIARIRAKLARYTGLSEQYLENEAVEILDAWVKMKKGN